MDTYTCTIKLNITNGLGDKVFNEVQNAKVPDMINEELASMEMWKALHINGIPVFFLMIYT